MRKATAQQSLQCNRALPHCLKYLDLTTESGSIRQLHDALHSLSYVKNFVPQLHGTNKERQRAWNTANAACRTRATTECSATRHPSSCSTHKSLVLLEPSSASVNL